MDFIKEIKIKKIGTLIAAEYNPRSLSDEQFETISDSLKRFGFVDPVLVNMHKDRKNIIIGGHQRVKVAKKLGYKEVPTVELKLTLDKEKELNIRLNKNTGEFDEDLLTEFFEVEELLDWGFNADELYFFEPEEEEDVEEDEGPEEPPEVPITELGRIYHLGDHRLMCGDSTSKEDVKKLIGENEEVNLWITDPPYNVAYEGKTEEALTIDNDDMNDEDFRKFLVDAYTAADSVMKAGAVFYIWHADSEGYNFRGAAHDAGWQIRQCLIWVKNSLVMGRQDYHWKHEPCLYGWKEGAAHYWGTDRKQTTVIEHDRPTRNDIHPTMKPIGLFAYQIKNSSKKGDIVLDSFAGSGTTIIACEETGRKARVMEFDPRYCDVIVRRYCKLKDIDPDEVFKTGIAT